MDAVEQPLVGAHVEPRCLAVGVGQRERHLAADSLALGVADHQRAQALGALLVVGAPTIDIEQVRAARPLTEQLRLPLELSAERGRERRAGDEPDALGLELHERGHLGRGAVAPREQVRLVDNQPVRFEVAQEPRRE
eukprot:1232076-Prymnesium_polylepis.1